MNLSRISIGRIHRTGVSNQGVTKQERLSCDFIIDGKSLLELLTKSISLDSPDLMGCFVSGFPNQNEHSRSALLCLDAAPLESGRVPLYICPECGDLGCGLFAARVSKVPSGYTWNDFAYENGYEAPAPCLEVPTFRFADSEYLNAIDSAVAL